jgi:hypothetical protein
MDNLGGRKVDGARELIRHLGAHRLTAVVFGRSRRKFLSVLAVDLFRKPAPFEKLVGDLRDTLSPVNTTCRSVDVPGREPVPVRSIYP